MKTHIGVFDDERISTQDLKLDASIQIPVEEFMLSEDELNDGVCYAELSERITDLATKKEYKTIEFLANEIYELIKSSFSKNTKVKVVLWKPTPAMECHIDSASCEIMDE